MSELLIEQSSLAETVSQVVTRYLESAGNDIVGQIQLVNATSGIKKIVL